MFITELWSIIVTYLSNLDDVNQLIYVMAIKANREKCCFDAKEIMRNYVFNTNPFIPKIIAICHEAENITNRAKYMQTYYDSMLFTDQMHNNKMRKNLYVVRIYINQIIASMDDKLQQRIKYLFKRLLNDVMINEDDYEDDKTKIILYPDEIMACLI